MDGIVAKEFAKDYPIEMTKAITGSLAKGGLQYLATDAVRSEKGTCAGRNRSGRWSVFPIHNPVRLALWSTLPKQIQFCKSKTPASQRLTLRESDELSEESFPWSRKNQTPLD